MPSAATLTNLYTVPGGGTLSAIVSCINVCNQSTATTSFRIAIRTAGTAPASSQYIAYDTEILGNEIYSFTEGITLETTDVITVYATLATVSFSAFGQQL